MDASVLVSTVGVSLLNNIERSGDRELVLHLQNKTWHQVARELRRRSPSDKICGAEINSITLLRDGKHGISPSASLYFLVSDTEVGKQVGEVLKCYYSRSDTDVHVKVIEGLNDDPASFRKVGLRNLVRLIGDAAKRSGGVDNLALNPLGGYKAAVAVAGIVGQAFGIPVYYKSEFFDDQVIVIPQLPIAPDDAVYAANATLFSKLETSGTIDCDDFDITDEKLNSLLDVVNIGGKQYAALTFVGEIFFQAIRARTPIEPNLPPHAEAKDRKRPSFTKHHYPDGFTEFVIRVWEQSPYIKTAYDVDYDRQKGIQHASFDYRPANNEIVGGFRSDYGGRFAIVTTASTTAHRLAILQDLNKRFAGS